MAYLPISDEKLQEWAESDVACSDVRAMAAELLEQRRRKRCDMSAVVDLFHLNINRLKLQAGDILLIRHPKIGADQVAALWDALESLDLTERKITVLFVSGGYDLAVLDEKAMREHGWVREAADQPVFDNDLRELLQWAQRATETRSFAAAQGGGYWHKLIAAIGELQEWRRRAAMNEALPSGSTEEDFERWRERFAGQVEVIPATESPRAQEAADLVRHELAKCWDEILQRAMESAWTGKPRPTPNPFDPEAPRTSRVDLA